MSRPAGLRELLEQLLAAETRFVLVGGLAVNAWGYLRATRDIDIVPDPDPENLDRLARLLESLGGKVEVDGGQLASSAIGTFLKAGDRTLVTMDAGSVDVLQGLPQIPSYERLRADAKPVELDGIRVSICSLDDLLAMKRASTRPRDRDDVEALEALDGADA